MSCVSCMLGLLGSMLLTNFSWQPFLARVPYQFRSPTQSMIRCPRFNRIRVDPNWATNSITKNIIEHPFWRYDSRVYSTFFIFPPDPRYKFVLPMKQGSRPGQSWRPVGNGASFAHVEWKKLHVPDLYCWLPADHGFRLSSKKLSLACLSDVGSSCIYMHLSRTNAAGFQREALAIVSMFARLVDPGTGSIQSYQCEFL